MAYAIVNRTLQDSQGNVLNGATVTVRDHDTGALADIYSTRTSTTPIANSEVTADADGTIEFYAPTGTYRLVAVGAGGSETQVVDVWAVQDSLTDITPDQLMKVGAFGLGETALSSAAFTQLFSDDFNTVVRVSGRFSLDGAGNTNGPPIGNPVGVLEQQLLNVGAGLERIYQTFYRMNGSAAGDFGIFARYYFYGDGWSPWRRIDNERGSNSNGDYVRFPDGTQICTSQVISAAADDRGDGTYSSPYSTVNLTWTYPAAFTATPVINDQSWVSINNNDVCKANIPNATATDTGTFRIVSLSSATAGDIANARLTAIGRWF